MRQRASLLCRSVSGTLDIWDGRIALLELDWGLSWIELVNAILGITTPRIHREIT